MPASPLYRLEFEDGTAIEMRGNLWVFRVNHRGYGRPRFTSVGLLCAGDIVRLEQDGEAKAIKTIVQLPYKATRRRKTS